MIFLFMISNSNEYYLLKINKWYQLTYIIIIITLINDRINNKTNV